MRKWKYQDLDGEHIITEDWLWGNFFPQWAKKMFDIGKDEEATFENCIKDFIVVHWAEEVK